MNLDAARLLLAAHGQSHLLSFYDRLEPDDQRSLLEQIGRIDFGLVDRLKALLPADRAAGGRAGDAPGTDRGGDGASAFSPVSATRPEPAERAAAERRGVAALRAGAVGALLVAGGQGTRLGFPGPKGCCPIGPVSGEPLFFFHARKLLARKRAFGRSVPLYVMTSAGNDGATRRFFEDRDYFGLDPEDVFFLVQGSCPALDPQGRMILEAPGRIFLSPDGHGGVLAALEASGAFADMRRRGVETLCYFQVDNPMVNVADPVFVGFHLETGAEWTMKACERNGPGEKMGMPVLQGGRVTFLEYTEQPLELRESLGPDGALRFRWGAPAIHAFSVPFLERAAGAGLPFHLAHKKVPFAGPGGVVETPSSPNAYKFEKFVFDALPLSRNVQCLAFDREEEYSPVKNATGDKSPAAAKADLSRKWARWLRAAGVEVPLDEAGFPLRPVEIDPAFADGPAALRDALSAASGGLPRPDPSAPLLLRAPSVGQQSGR